MIFLKPEMLLPRMMPKMDATWPPSINAVINTVLGGEVVLVWNASWSLT